MFKYIKRQYPILLVLVIVAVVANYLDVKFSMLMLELIDITYAGEVEEFFTLVIPLVIFLVLGNVAFILCDYVASVFIMNTAVNIKSSYLTEVFKKNLNEYAEENTANYISALTNDYDVIEDKYLGSFCVIIISTANLIGGVVIFVRINYIALLICLGLMIINALVSWVSDKPVNKHNDERSNMFANYTAYIKEVLSAFHIIKTNDLHNRIKDDYKKKSKQLQTKSYVIDKIHSYIFAIQNTNFQVTFIGIFLFIVYMSIMGEITIGGVITILLSAEKLVWPITNFSEAFPSMLSVKSIVKRMKMHIKNKTDYTETISYESLIDNITFNDVCFSYDENQVLDNINLKFEKGKKYLLIGPSGGGKSTILRLLRKYCNPQKGSILIDGKPLGDIRKEQYFKTIANIEQNVFVFEDSVKNNLTLYKEYTNQEIYDAINKAGLNDFIKSLPKGLDTIIYDNGRNISGGERSRLAIARGLLNNSQIVFLDEAFASLDYDKAREIERCILDLNGITVINVSHVIIKENKSKYDNIYLINKMKALEVISNEI